MSFVSRPACWGMAISRLWCLARERVGGQAGYLAENEDEQHRCPGITNDAPFMIGKESRVRSVCLLRVRVIVERPCPALVVDVRLCVEDHLSYKGNQHSATSVFLFFFRTLFLQFNNTSDS